MNQFAQEQQTLKSETSTIFDEENYVDEETFMMSLQDDVYTGGVAVDVNAFIKDMVMIETTSLMMINNSYHFDAASIITETEGRTSKHTMEAAVGFVNAANNLYNLTVNGSPCAECGKVVKYMPPNGYCSLECAAKALVKRITSHITGNYDRQTPEVIEKVKNILGYVDFCLNVIQKIPDLVASMAKMPPEYKEYATIKINIVFLLLKKVINLLLIKKNDLLISMLKQIDDGTIDSYMMPMFKAIETVIKTIVLLRDKMNIALQSAMDAISNASMLFYIGPLEYGFFMTLKSWMAVCPFVKTNPRVYPPSLLGRPFWGAGAMTIPFDMSKCQFTIDIGGMSALLNVDQKKLMKIIRAVFRPINEVEYLMDPALFDVRLALSDLNTPAILKLCRLLEMTIVIGGDFLPSYKNLKLTNIWFIVAILTCWGPTTRSIFGDFIFHGPL